MVLWVEARLVLGKWDCLGDVRGEEDGEKSEERSCHLHDSHGFRNVEGFWNVEIIGCPSFDIAMLHFDLAP